MALARVARDRGAEVISITGSTQTMLFEHSDVVVTVETPDDTDLFTPTTSRIAALVVAGRLSTRVARRPGTPYNRRPARMKRTLGQMPRNAPS